MEGISKLDQVYKLYNKIHSAECGFETSVTSSDLEIVNTVAKAISDLKYELAHKFDYNLTTKFRDSTIEEKEQLAFLLNFVDESPLSINQSNDIFNEFLVWKFNGLENAPKFSVDLIKKSYSYRRHIIKYICDEYRASSL